MNSKKNIQSYGRFKNLPWFEKMSGSIILIGGAGGIGSHTAFYLARAGANVVVVDMDTVEEHNIAGQLYGLEDVGKKKVDALSDVITRLCGENNLTTLDEEITEDNKGQCGAMIPRCDAVIVGFDNLKARGILYKLWRDGGKKDSIFIDGRLSAESGQVYVLTKSSTEDEIKGYEATYFSDDERVELPCTMKATTHCGGLIASLIVANVTNWFNNLAAPIMLRSLSNVDFHLMLMKIDQPVFKEVKEEVYET